jgi:hypothetical protein
MGFLLLTCMLAGYMTYQVADGMFALAFYSLYCNDTSSSPYAFTSLLLHLSSTGLSIDSIQQYQQISSFAQSSSLFARTLNMTAPSTNAQVLPDIGKGTAGIEVWAGIGSSFRWILHGGYFGLPKNLFEGGSINGGALAGAYMVGINDKMQGSAGGRISVSTRA